MQPSEALALARAKADRLRVEDGRLPHITGDDGCWRRLSPIGREDEALTGLPWTGGFVTGQLWLAGRNDRASAVTELLAPRAGEATTHDLGFLFWPSAVLGHLATGDDRYRELGLEAARALTERALPSGVLQVIGDLDDRAFRGRTIVDTWPNLLLLWWAEREGNEVAGGAARAHLDATLEALLRPDGSTVHAARIGDDRTVLERGTHNGWSPDSTWARGQAWAVHGLTSAARATGDPRYREAAERAARWFLDQLPADLVPPWDFDAPPSAADASAAAIVASALFDLGWGDDGQRLLDALAATCLNGTDTDGALLHCCYRHGIGLGFDCATVWGDFFLLDALTAAAAPEDRLDPLAP